MKMGIRENSNSWYLNIFYLLVCISMFVTFRFWLPERELYRDYRLEDYHDNSVKKFNGKRFLPWKRFADTEKFEVKDKNTRYILVWTSSKNKPFHTMGWGYEVFSDKFCPHLNCFITDDINYLKEETEFDAILFGAEVAKLTENLLPMKRLPYQKYVFVSTESAQVNSVCTQKFDNYFNWTWTYRLDSDIRTGLVVRDSNETIIAPKKEVHWIPAKRKVVLSDDLRAIIKKKSKAVAWIVSNCNTHSYREKIALELREELKKYFLTLDIYGKCGELSCESEENCDKRIERYYYFYLAFEDSVCEDYVTTELLRALHHNAVPIVYGGANYSRILPQNSYLDANKLTVAKLAVLIKGLIRGKKNRYLKYFWWKDQYYYYKMSESVDTDEYCELCRLLNSKRFTENSTYVNFRKWWNHPEEVCINWYE